MELQKVKASMSHVQCLVKPVQLREFSATTKQMQESMSGSLSKLNVWLLSLHRLQSKGQEPVTLRIVHSRDRPVACHLGLKPALSKQASTRVEERREAPQGGAAVKLP